MSTLIARNDAVVVQQVTTLTPTAVNNAVYKVSLNTKVGPAFTADASATVKEIVEGLQPLLSASTIAEVAEAVYTEDDLKITATGLDTGMPFTVVDASTGGGSIAVSTTATAKSPNHWIAENFSTGALPVNGDDVVLTGLTEAQSFYWNLDQNAVTLASLSIRADSLAQAGLVENTGTYYQANYRPTHLKISASRLRIGDGIGQGSRLLKLDLGSNACEATILQTGANSLNQNDAPVHLVGSHASNTLQLLAGAVDIAMIPGYTAEWPVIVASNGTVRCGEGVTLGTIEASGGSLVETRTAVTTYRTRDNGRGRHIGSGNITLLDIQGGPMELQATDAMTIATLNGYSGKELDLSRCDSLVTVTNMTSYGTPSAPFTIRDPNNKLVMTSACSCPNGAQSLVVITGSGKTVKVV